MIFKQWQQVVGLKQPLKTQTRRPVKPRQEANRWDVETDVINEVIQWLDNGKEYPNNMRSLYVVGHTYAVQPGRGKKAVGHITITRIRWEKLGDISAEDCVAEGIIVEPSTPPDFNIYKCPICQKWSIFPIDAYVCLWEHIYGDRAWDRMKDDDVWAISFVVVGTDEK